MTTKNRNPIHLLHKCEDAIGYKFRNIRLLENALTHASSCNENIMMSNERLELLGDAVLGLVISEYLYRIFPDFTEGDISLIRSEVVSRSTLARVARVIKLDTFCTFVGDAHTTFPVSVLANVFEAIVAAIYLDGGNDYARKFILDNLIDEMESSIKNPYQNNYKSILQFISHQYFGITPSYESLATKGTNHNEIFTTCVVIGKRKLIASEGKNKKESEQAAAQAALQILALEESVIADKVNRILQTEKPMHNTNKIVDMPHLFHNSKSILQYVIEKYGLPSPVYSKDRVHIQPDRKKIFWVHVSLGGRAFPQTQAPKWKEAERLAARTTLEILAEEYSTRASPLLLPCRDFCSVSASQSVPTWYWMSWQQWNETM